MADSEAPRLTAEIGLSGLKEWGGLVHEEYDFDLRGLRGIKIYDEMRRNDPTVAMGLRLIKWVLGRIEWHVEPGGDTPADKEAAEFLDSCRTDMSVTWSKFLRDALTCLDFGFSWLEFTLKQRNGQTADPPSRYDDGRIGWRKFTLLGHDTLASWDFDDKGTARGFVQQVITGYTNFAQVTVPIEKSLLFRIDDEKNNPEGQSLLRCIYDSYYKKKNVEEIEAIGIERDLTGVLIIHPPVNATTADKTKAIQLLEQFKNDDMAGFVAPQFGPEDHEKWRFEIINSPGNKSIDTDRVIQRYDLRIARAFLAQFLMLGQSSTGSFALSRDMSDVFEVALGAIVQNLEETINLFAVPPLFKLNDFGKLMALPEIKAGKVSHSDLDKFATALRTLADGKLLTPSAQLEQFIRQEMELPELTEEEIEAQEEARQAGLELAKQQAANPEPKAPKPEEDTGQEEPAQATESLAFHGGAHSGHKGSHAGPAKGKGNATGGIKAEGDAASLVRGLPPKAHQAAQAAGLKEVRVLDDVEMQKALGLARQDTGAVGMYRSDTGTLLLRKGQTDLNMSFQHELAHVYDGLQADGKFGISENSEWLQAGGWKAKGKNYKLKETIYNRPVSEYGRSSPWEDFAESFGKYVTGTAFDRRVMQGESEGRYAFVQKYAKDLGFES